MTQGIGGEVINPQLWDERTQAIKNHVPSQK